MKNKSWFTLIELLVSVSLSMIIMFSVGLLVSMIMNLFFMQDKNLKNADNFQLFNEKMHNIFSNIETKYPFYNISSSSGFILKQRPNFDKGWFSFISLNTYSWFYCQEDIKDPLFITNTNHIFIKTFVPFEEKDEDIFDNSYESIFTGSILSGSTNYISDALNHVIYKDWEIIIWNFSYFWNIIWDTWTSTYLNNPSGLAIYEDFLFISDSLNNRILAYNTISKKVYNLLWIEDWILEPSWLYFSDINKSLYISNSWKNEILQYSVLALTWAKLWLDFTSDEDIKNIKKIEIEFFNKNKDSQNITWGFWTWDYNININTNIYDLAYLSWNTNKITYYFSDFLDNYYNINSTCANNYTNYIEDSFWAIIKETIQDCTGWSWTIKKYKSNSYKDFIKWDKISIKSKQNINWDFTSSGTYYLKMSIFWDSKIEKYFSFFENWDLDILSPNANYLSVFKSSIPYPSSIYWSGSNIIVQSFIERKKYEFNLDWEEKNTYALKAFDFTKLKYNLNRDYILTSPFLKYNINFTDNLLSFSWTYYNFYDCYNENKRSTNDFILKKSFR